MDTNDLIVKAYEALAEVVRRVGVTTSAVSNSG